ncbi:MAG: hypothetical protein UX25_C0022G0002 [Candidatus Woesebacteria bacterium GW2011_GWC2_45_9]|uniref:Uncharacterized protein n=2 Tax=Microgenomates group TaxID=1794810 RepID=A0A0G1QGJ2_9BACT|nr:MAG: hypothetical protein UW61_C0008G0008 [Candidatus Curtissbacteria bacterium GW2011_GWC1_44_33]KKU16873.1 MAG: hypothetical protein UX25_C0022G0002 [Candidatus Woesebacteria bacterium GW2011_GWC2_45_9]
MSLPKQLVFVILVLASLFLGKSVAVDLSDAELPILGNTEDVPNSQNADEGLDDAEKTNEYVSWYLNGVIGRAESGEDVDLNKAVNFSGPLKKLLPRPSNIKPRLPQSIKGG